MKKIGILVFIAGMLAIIGCDNANKTTQTGEITLNSYEDTMNYCLGSTVAFNLKSQGMDSVNPVILTAAFEDVMNGGELIIEKVEADEFLNAYFGKLQQVKWEQNLVDGQAFLEKNKMQEGVITLDNGIQYIVMKEGSGKQPTAESTVTTHYHGTLINGTVFDSSVERGQPAQFPINQVIKGWGLIIPMMKEGAKWKVFIPQDLAYGANPRPGGVIEPYMALVFDIELISVDD